MLPPVLVVSLVGVSTFSEYKWVFLPFQSTFCPERRGLCSVRFVICMAVLACDLLEGTVLVKHVATEEHQQGMHDWRQNGLGKIRTHAFLHRVLDQCTGPLQSVIASQIMQWQVGITPHIGKIR